MSPLVQLIDDALLDATLARARAAPRGRINHNFHSELAANPSRFLNAWTRGSYAAPHRHLLVPKPESFIMLRGEMVLFVFDDGGRRDQRDGGLLRGQTRAVRGRYRQAVRPLGAGRRRSRCRRVPTGLAGGGGAQPLITRKNRASHRARKFSEIEAYLVPKYTFTPPEFATYLVSIFPA